MAGGRLNERRDGSRSTRPCYDKALDLLARRAHFRRELCQKLLAREYPPEEVERTLDKLEHGSFLDDRATAEAFVSQRRERRGWGRRRLVAELSKRGVDDSVIDSALAQVNPEAELDLARDVARRWRLRSRRDDTALSRHLERRGFGPRVIVEVLGEGDVSPESP